MKQIIILPALFLFSTVINLAQEEKLSPQAATLRELIAEAERTGGLKDDPVKPAKATDKLNEEFIPAPPAAVTTETKKIAPQKSALDNRETKTEPTAQQVPEVSVETEPRSISNPPATFQKPPKASIEKAVKQLEPAELPNKKLDTTAATENVEINNTAAASVSATTPPTPKPPINPTTPPKSTPKTVYKTKPPVKKETPKPQPEEAPVALAEEAEKAEEAPTASAEAVTPKKGKTLGEILFPKRGGLFKKKHQ